MKIHFAAFFGVDYDLDLLKWWSDFYLSAKLDSYQVFLHRFPEAVTEEHVALFHAHGFHAMIAPSTEYRDGLLQKKVMEQYANSLPVDDVLVIADGDEFQATANHEPLPYREIFEEYDMIFGILQDRYGNKLEPCTQNPFNQYPYVEDDPRLFKAFYPPTLPHLDWPFTRRTKILGAKVGLRVNFSGSHGVGSLPAATRVLYDQNVTHFAWRESAKRKVLAKSYYSKETIEQLQESL